jgi:hypothetical protein
MEIHIARRRELGYNDSGQGPVVGSCEHGKES